MANCGHSSDPASASPESRALRQHSAFLVTTIVDPLRLSWVLFAEEVIDETTRERASKGNLIVLEKNDILVAAITRRVEADPILFHRLVNILKNDGDSLLKSLGGKLEATYNQLTKAQHMTSLSSHIALPPQQLEHVQPPLSTSPQLCSPQFRQPPLSSPQQVEQLTAQQLGSSLPPPTKRPRHTPPPLHSPLHPLIVPPQPQSVIYYADYLRDFYQTSELPVCNKWPPTPSKKYINLAVISREEVSSKELEKFQRATLHGDINDILEIKAPIKLQDILDTKPGEKLQCVLVEGAPGIGKTTLSWEACKRWGKSELFQQYTMVFLLRLRDETVQNSTCIADIIFHEDKGCQQEISHYLTYTRGKDILIIMEGLDELPQHLLTQPSIFTHLLAGKVLPRATILVTSRPSVTVRLWENWKERISRHIEILGFTKQNITEYIESVMPAKGLCVFDTYLSMNPHIKTMMYVPIHAAIVIEVYRCCHRSHKPLPTTITDLYTCLTQTILLRYLDSHPKYNWNKTDLQQFTDLPPPVYQDFYKLAEIAYNGAIKQQLIFYNQHKEIEHLGFMDTVTELFPNQQSISFSYNFLHLSVQEYLASYFVSCMHTCEQEQLLMEMCTKQYLKNMGLFLAGITQFKSMDRLTVKTIIEEEFENNTPDGSLRLSTYILQLLHESRYANILDDHLSYSCTVTDYSGFSVLGYCVANSNYKWRLQLGDYDQHMQSTDKIDLLVQSLKSHSDPDYNIESIVCYYDTPEYAKHLLMELPQYTLQQLQELVLRNNPLNRQPLPQCVFEHILLMISRLNTLRLHFGAVRTSGAITIATALHSNSTLIVLNISDNDISDSGAIAIASSLRSNTTLARLNISDNDISDSGAIAIADMLQINYTLVVVNLTGNNIGNDGQRALLQIRTTMKQLTLFY